MGKPLFGFPDFGLTPLRDRVLGAAAEGGSVRWLDGAVVRLWRAAVWVQWVLNYVTDADLVGFLRRAAAALRRDGVLVVKESVARKRGGGFYADLGECSITRTDAHFRRLFGEAGLAVHASCRQPGMPRGLFPVRMYALRPAGQPA